MQKHKYKVATQCMSYNHRPYIEDALNIFVSQKTSFPVVYIIVDDASNDGEPEFLRKWADINLDLAEGEESYIKEMPYGELIFAKHRKNQNSFFAILLLSENHYQTGRDILKFEYISTWTDKSEYFAFCEGDDYWLDPNKLQKQVEYLDNNQDYGMVATASRIYVQGIGMKEGVFGHEYRGFEDLLNGNYFFYASLLKRKTIEDRYNQEIGDQKGWKMGDWPRILHCAIVSKIGFIEEPMSVYRVLPNSASHSDDFNKFKAFNESSVAVSKWFINKYQLNAEKLDSLLDNWLHRRLLLKACSVGNIEYVNQNKRKVSGLSAKERITVFLSSNYFTFALYCFYLRVRKTVIGYLTD